MISRCGATRRRFKGVNNRVGHTAVSLAAVLLALSGETRAADATANARLASYEVQAYSQIVATGPAAPVSRCLSLRGDDARLACFEGTLTTKPAPLPSPVPDQMATSVPRMDTVAVEPERRIDLQSQPTPLAPRQRSFRMELGGGYGQGRYDGELDNFKLQSTVGGAGWLESAGLWWDHVGGGDFSLGAEAISFNTRSRIKGYLPQGVTVNGTNFPDPLTVAGHASVQAYLGYLNIAYSPKIQGGIQPFVGLGLGAGWAKLDAKLSASSALIESIGEDYQQSSVVGGAQAFWGMIIPMGSRFYFSPNMRVLIFTGKPLGLAHQFIDLVGGGSFGMSF